jgi:hypothetical protein
VTGLAVVPRVALVTGLGVVPRVALVTGLAVVPRVGVVPRAFRAFLVIVAHLRPPDVPTYSNDRLFPRTVPLVPGYGVPQGCR